MSSDKKPKQTFKTLGEVMEAANLEEAGITYRPYPDSAADHFRVSSRKEENLPPGIELFADIQRSRARANNNAYEQEEE